MQQCFQRRKEKHFGGVATHRQKVVFLLLFFTLCFSYSFIPMPCIRECMRAFWIITSIKSQNLLKENVSQYILVPVSLLLGAMKDGELRGRSTATSPSLFYAPYSRKGKQHQSFSQVIGRHLGLTSLLQVLGY